MIPVRRPTARKKCHHICCVSPAHGAPLPFGVVIRSLSSCKLSIALRSIGDALRAPGAAEAAAVFRTHDLAHTSFLKAPGPLARPVWTESCHVDRRLAQRSEHRTAVHRRVLCLEPCANHCHETGSLALRQRPKIPKYSSPRRHPKT